MRILLAEDEVTIARALKVMLEKNMYAVDMVHNGVDALDYIRTVEYGGSSALPWRLLPPLWCGEPVALVSRSQTVALTEAVNAIVLGNS